MKTCAAVAEWCGAAAAQFGDPSATVCHLFLRWTDDIQSYAGDELVCGQVEGEFVLCLAHGKDGNPDVFIPIAVDPLGPRVGADGVLQAFGVEEIAAGLWALVPSLNVPQLIHGFVTLYGLPSPAPWQDGPRIILATRLG